VTTLIGVPPIVEDARRALAAVAGPGAAESMFEGICRRFSKKPDGLVAEAERCLRMHGLSWPPEPPALTEEPEEDAPSEDDEPRLDEQAAPRQVKLEAAGGAVEEEPPRPKKKKGYFWAPDAIFNPKLTVSSEARLVFLHLCRRANTDGTCWPSQRGIADDTGLAGQSVRKQVIPELEAHSLIEHDAGSRRYRIQPAEKWQLQTDAECCSRAACRSEKAMKAAKARWAGRQKVSGGQAAPRTGRADPAKLEALLGPNWWLPTEDDE
jgi:hypothetical protein